MDVLAWSMGAAQVIVVLLLPALLDFQRVRQKSWRDSDWKTPAFYYSLALIFGSLGLVVTLFMARFGTSGSEWVFWVPMSTILLLLVTVAVVPVIYHHFAPLPKDAADSGQYGARTS